MGELEIRDPTIKLFGQRIALPLKNMNNYSDCKFVSSEPTLVQQKVISCEELVPEKQRNDRAKPITDQTSSEFSENPSIEKESSSTSKKPDKILPCPRCKSMDTKFCYYNNYNVNQPRHFCKNCQRYWTAGGTMRNVPVGAGRRKNKTPSFSHFRIHQHQFLTFGSNSSISNSQNHNFLTGIENGDENSSKSSITATNSSEKVCKITSHQSVVKNGLHFPLPLQSFNGFPWPFPPLFLHAGFPVYYPVPPYTMPPTWTVTNHTDRDSLTDSSVSGKRLRDDEIVKQSNPKSLKMDDPNKVGNSSILSTHGSGLFGSFQQTANAKEENHMESCLLLQANPAAFSRALNFREIA